jgi:plastocyanin
MAISIRTSSVGGVPATRRGSVGRLGSVAAVVAILLVAGGSHAHGPTIEIRHDAMKPTLLNLFVGSTVHFKNMVEMPGGHVVVDESGTLESPPLEAPGDGWHYTFEKEGTFELFIKQHPAARARIVIVPQR